jgi:DNA-binding transcriptional LysR family regulator
MDFNQLEYVMAVIEEKSISKAAKKLYISQPSLSQYIIRLEERLGVKLFDRTGKSLSLTFAGKKYVETAKIMLDLNKKLKRELSDIADSKKGRIIIGIPNQTSRYILPLILPEFHKQFPEIELVIEEDVTMQLEEMLIEGKIDIAILNLPIKHDKILYEPISVERIFLVSPENYDFSSKMQLNNGEKLRFSYLRDEEFILLKQGQNMRITADKIFQRAQMEPRIILEVTNLDTAKRIAAAGMGFTFVPENVVWLSNAEKYKNYFLVDDITFTIVVAYRPNEYLTEATRKFITITKSIVALNNKIRTNNSRNYPKIYIK